MDGENAAEIKQLTETLTQASHKLAAAMYQQASPSGEHHPGAGAGTTHRPNFSGSDDNVVDAEFQEVA